jgi:hypothetical protein
MVHTVDSDAEEVANLLDLRPGQLERAKIPEHEMVIRAARLKLVPVLAELVRKCLRVLDYLLCVCLPGRLRRLQQGRRDTRDGVVVWATLACREYGIVHALLEVLVNLAILAEEDEAGTRSAKRFVSTRALLKNLAVPKKQQALTLSS